jgi:transposase
LRCIRADGGYSGPDFANGVAAYRKTNTLRLEVVERNKAQKAFSVLPKRWIVERTFGWFMKHRRLVRHYEVKTSHAEALVQIAMIGIMVRRLG